MENFQIRFEFKFKQSFHHNFINSSSGLLQQFFIVAVSIAYFQFDKWTKLLKRFSPFSLVRAKLFLQVKLAQKLNKNTNETVHYLSTLEFIKNLPSSP